MEEGRVSSVCQRRKLNCNVNFHGTRGPWMNFCVLIEKFPDMEMASRGRYERDFLNNILLSGKENPN
jgi:hypothetical protein